MSSDAVRYLLGQLPEEERLRLEEAYFSEGGSFEEMLAVEDDLFFDYVTGQLAGGDRAAFEQRFLANDAGRRKLAFADALIRALKARQEGNTSKSVAEPATRTARWSPVMQWGLAAAAVVFAAASVWLARDLTRTRADLSAAQSEAQRAAAAQPASPPQRLPSVVAISLAPGLTRGNSDARRIQIAQGADIVRVQLQLVEPASAGSRRVIVRTADGNEVWSQLVPLQAGDEALTIDVNAAVFTTADYEIVVAASPGERPLSYAFTALRRP
jgi:hypothetical protein